MNATLLAAALLALTPTDTAVVDRVDCVEVNHFFDEHGKRIFDQAIYYDWNPYEGRYVVVAWRIIKSRDMLPIHDHQRGDWFAVWHDSLDDVLREVRTRSVRETRTQYDPELIERETLPKEERRELSRPPKRRAGKGE